MIPTFVSVTLCNDRDLVSVRYVFECFHEVRLDICHRLRFPDATVSGHELEYRSAASAFAYSENKVAGRCSTSKNVRYGIRFTGFGTSTLSFVVIPVFITACWVVPLSEKVAS